MPAPLPSPPLRSAFWFRLFAVFTGITALMTVAFTLWYTLVTGGKLRATAVDRLQLQANHLAEQIRIPLYAENRETLQDLAEEMSREREICVVQISSQDGRLLADYRRKDDYTPHQHLTATAGVRTSRLFTGPELMLGAKGEPEGTPIGSVRLERNTGDLDEAVTRMVMTSIGLAAAFWLAATALGFVVLRSVLRSFDSLMTGIRRMQDGDLATPIPVAGDDEPGRAAAAVNRLAEQVLQREEENRKLHEELLEKERLEGQNEKKMLMAKLIQANRMTSIGVMASCMAHEINNPVGAISMANEFLTKGWEQAVPLLDRVAAEEGNFSLAGMPYNQARTDLGTCCTTIARSVERITQVIADLRSYSVGERNQLSPGVDVNKVASDALSIIKAHERRANVTITAELAAGVPAITGSHHQLVQVLVNLLLNAVQAMPETRGTITISTAHLPETDSVRLSVRDTGAGIPPEIKARIMEPFVSSRLETGGSGLGLFVSNFIVTNHGGTLEFTPAPDRGTVASIVLPVTPPAPPSQPAD